MKKLLIAILLIGSVASQVNASGEIFSFYFGASSSLRNWMPQKAQAVSSLPVIKNALQHPYYAAAALVAVPLIGYGLYKAYAVMSNSMLISHHLNNYVNSCANCSDLRSKGFQEIVLNNDIPQEIKRIVFAITNNDDYRIDQMKEQLVALSNSLTGKLFTHRLITSIKKDIYGTNNCA